MATPVTNTVFIAGSRKVARLPAAIEARLDAIVDKGFDVVIGDAGLDPIPWTV